MHIRTATKLDIDKVREINLLAFPESENQIVATLAVNLLDLETRPPTLSFIAEQDNEAVGHIAFSPVAIGNNKDCIAYTLAPLSVKPKYQHQQIGSTLIRHGMKLLSETGVTLLFVYGDPKYYGRFGFNTETASLYTPPYKLQYPFGWLATTLRPHTQPKEPTEIICVEVLMRPELW